jgi:hypothetical protein
MLEDGLLMAAIYAIKDKSLTNLVNQNMEHQDYLNPILLYDTIKEDQLTQLHHQVRKLNTGHKFIITIHNCSSILNQIDVIREYEYFDFEVCVSKYLKEKGGFGSVFVDHL